MIRIELKKISIHGFAKFSNFDFEFGKVNVIERHNGWGKTTMQNMILFALGFLGDKSAEVVSAVANNGDAPSVTLQVEVNGTVKTIIRKTGTGKKVFTIDGFSVKEKEDLWDKLGIDKTFEYSMMPDRLFESKLTVKEKKKIFLRNIGITAEDEKNLLIKTGLNNVDALLELDSPYEACLANVNYAKERYKAQSTKVQTLQESYDKQAAWHQTEQDKMSASSLENEISTAKNAVEYYGGIVDGALTREAQIKNEISENTKKQEEVFKEMMDYSEKLSQQKAKVESLRTTLETYEEHKLSIMNTGYCPLCGNTDTSNADKFIGEKTEAVIIAGRAERIYLDEYAEKYSEFKKRYDDCGMKVSELMVQLKEVSDTIYQNSQYRDSAKSNVDTLNNKLAAFSNEAHVLLNNMKLELENEKIELEKLGADLTKAEADMKIIITNVFPEMEKIIQKRYSRIFFDNIIISLKKEKDGVISEDFSLSFGNEKLKQLSYAETKLAHVELAINMCSPIIMVDNIDGIVGPNRDKLISTVQNDSIFGQFILFGAKWTEEIQMNTIEKDIGGML